MACRTCTKPMNANKKGTWPPDATKTGLGGQPQASPPAEA